MNLFRKATATVALVTLVSGILSTGVSAYSNGQVSAANNLAAAGIINSQADASGYNLSQNILRTEIAKVAANIADLDAKTSCSNSFSDVSATTPNTWACSYVEALLDAELISANAKFNGESNITKAEAVKLMLSAAGFENFYSNVATWQEETVSFAVNEGIVNSFSDYGTDATRGFIFEVADEAMNAGYEDESLGDFLGDFLDYEDEVEVEAPAETETPTEVVETPSVNYGDAMVSLSPESPMNGNVAANTARTTMIAFDVTAGDQDLSLEEADLKYTGLSDKDNITTLAIYLGNDKISKNDGSFDSDNEETLKFEKDTIVLAGETKTLYVTATLSGGTLNESHQVTLERVVTSAGELDGGPLVGATLNPVSVTNKGALTFGSDKATKDLTVGEEGKLAGFELETNKKEAVIVKSVTFTVGGTIDAEDDLSNLSLTVNDVEVLADLSVNSDDEIVADVEYTIPTDDDATFELYGTVSGFDSAITPTVQLTLTDSYAIGATTGVGVDITAGAVSNSLDIDGADINVSFDKSSIDEVKPDSQDNLIGTLTISSPVDYLIDEVRVTVTGTGANIDELRLGGEEEDNSDAATTKIYKYEDIDLSANETLTLDLELDTDENAGNGDNLRFDVEIIKVTDENNDDNSYTGTELNKLLSTNGFDHDVDVEFANLKLSATNFYNRTLVVANNIETVLYKGKISVGDADGVILQDINFKSDVDNLDYGYGTVYIDDLIKEVTLNVGGKSYEGEISAAGLVEFEGIDAEIAAGASNVVVTLVATLDDTDVDNGSSVEFDYVDASIAIEDSEGQDDNVSVDTSAASNDESGTYNVTTLNDRGIVVITQVDNSDFEDDVETTVLAGSNNVAIAQLEVKSEYEATDVEQLQFKISGDYSSSFDEVRLVNSNGTVDTAEAAEFDGTDTVISFEDFTITESDTTEDYKVVADINSYSTEGNSDVVTLGNLTATLVADSAVGGEYENFKGAESKEQLTSVTASVTNTDTVTVVPVLVTATTTNTFGSEDYTAEVSFYVNLGNNVLDNDTVYLKTMAFEAAAGTVFESVKNDDTRIFVGDLAGADKVLTATAQDSDYELGLNKTTVITFKVNSATDATSTSIVLTDSTAANAGDIVVTVDGQDYTVSHDELDLGKYVTSSD